MEPKVSRYLKISYSQYVLNRLWLTVNTLIFICFVSLGDHKNLMDLPEEIIEKILMDDNLSYKDLKRMRLTSHGLRRIADSAIEKIDRKCEHAYLYVSI